MIMEISSDIKLALVTAVCILTIAAISKNILSAIFGPGCMFLVYLITKDKVKKSKICCSPLFWSAAIILISLAILAVYAI